MIDYLTDDIFRDLFIENEDVVLDAGLNPTIINDRTVIAQDLKHAILESGLAVELVAERSPSEIADVEYRIILLVENDLRIVPGSAKIQMIDNKRLLTATSYDFGGLQTWL